MLDHSENGLNGRLGVGRVLPAVPGSPLDRRRGNAGCGRDRYSPLPVN
jgi:hypothetical protein